MANIDRVSIGLKIRLEGEEYIDLTVQRFSCNFVAGTLLLYEDFYDTEPVETMDLDEIEDIEVSFFKRS